MIALLLITFGAWLLLTVVAWIVSLIFCCALTIALVVKVWAVLMIAALLYDVWANYKGNGGFF